MGKHKYFTQEDYGREGKFERSFACKNIRTLWPPWEKYYKGGADDSEVLAYIWGHNRL